MKSLKDVEHLLDLEGLNERCDKGFSDNVLMIDKRLLQNYGINEQKFQKVFSYLSYHWWNSATSVPDSEGKRFVQSSLMKDLQNPIKLAIIADDLETFKKHNKGNDDFVLFELSCICGAKNILNNFFLASEQGRQFLCHSENAIAFVLSSGKQDFALELAEIARELGRKDPGPIALYALNMKTLFFSSKIENVFSPKPLVTMLQSEALNIWRFN